MAGYSVTYTVVDNATKQIEAINRRITQMRAPLDRLSRQVSRFVDVSGLGKVAQGFEWIARAAGSVLRTLATIVPVMGAITGAASIAGMVKLVNSYAAWSRELVQTATNVGLTTDELQRFQDATALAGGNAADMTEALKTLHTAAANARVGLASPEQIQWFNRLNIQWNNSAGRLRSMADLLPEVARKIGQIRDPADRARASAALLGDENAKLLNTFRQSSKSLDGWLIDVQRYQELTDAQKQTLQRFAEAQGRLGVTFDRLGAQLAVVLAQRFEPLMQRFADFVDTHTPQIIAAVDRVATKFAAWLGAINWSDVETGIDRLLAGLQSVIDNLDTIKTVAEVVAGLFILKWGVNIVTAVAAVTSAIGGTTAAIAAMLLLLKSDSVGPSGPGTPEQRKAAQDRADDINKRLGYSGNFLTDLAIGVQKGFEAAWDRILHGPADIRPGAPGVPSPVQRQSGLGGYLPGGVTPASLGGQITAPSPIAAPRAITGGQPAVTALGTPAPGTYAPARETGEGSSGERNRNPLNLTALPGQASEGRFRRFSTWEEGVAASVRQLQINTEQHGRLTLAQQINRWAPKADANDPASYTARVAKEMGIDPHAPLNTRDPETLRRLVNAMAHVELGRQVPPAAIAKGVAMATGTAPPVTVPPSAPLNGSVDVSITHKNAPLNSAVTATGTGAVSVAPVRVEHQDMTSI
jgi:hypothetical protein